VPNPSGTTPVVVGAASVVGGPVDDDDVTGTSVVVVTVPGTAALEPNVSAVSSSPHAATATTTAPTAASTRHDTAVTVGVSVLDVPVTSSCDSCGAEEDELYAVHRQYVTPAEWDTPGREVTLDEVERWCYSCLTHYPHVLVEG